MTTQILTLFRPLPVPLRRWVELALPEMV